MIKIMINDTHEDVQCAHSNVNLKNNSCEQHGIKLTWTWENN